MGHSRAVPWERLHPLLPLMWAWNPGLLVVQEKVKPQKMDISAERAPRATPVLGMGQFPARGVWEGAEPSCPKAGLDLGTWLLFLGAQELCGQSPQPAPHQHSWDSPPAKWEGTGTEGWCKLWD